MAFKIKQQKRLELDSNPSGVVDAPQGTIGFFNGKKYKADGGTVWYEDVLEVNSIADLKIINDFKIGNTVIVKSYYGDDKGGGGRFKLISKNGTLTDDNGGTIIIATNLDRWERVLDNPDIIDIRLFGAVSGVQFSNVKNIFIPSSANPIGTIPDATDAINKAISWLDRERVVFPASSELFTIPSRKIIINGHYLLNPQGLNPVSDVAITVPNGIDFECVGQSSLHTNYDGINILLNEHYGTKHRINIYHKLWLGLSGGTQWYSTVTNPVPLDQTSKGVVLNSSRRVTLHVESSLFNYGFQLRDSEVEGTVDNIINLGSMLNNRRGVVVEAETSGGWANQNTFNNGAIRIVGYVDRHTSIRTDCDAIYNIGDNNVFINVNLEGGTNYQYLINDKAGTNIYTNPRFELAKAGQFTQEALGSITIGGYQYEPYMSSTISNWYDIGNNLDKSKRGYVKKPREHSVDIGGGMMRLRGFGTGSILPNWTLKLENTVAKESYLGIGKDDFKTRHDFLGEDDNGAIELHTGLTGTDYVDLKKKHQKFNIYNVITHTSGQLAGIGDWIDDTAVSGKWYYANDLFIMGVDLATDISENKFIAEPSYQIPIYLKDRKVMSPEFRGLKTAIKSSDTEAIMYEGAMLTPFGIYDDFSRLRVNTSGIKYNMFIDDVDFAVNTDDTDLMLYSSNILLRNLDSNGDTRNVYLTKKTIRYYAGREFFLYNAPQTSSYNYISHPIVLKNIKGGDITLNQGDWVTIKSYVGDSPTSGSFIVTSKSSSGNVKKIISASTYTLQPKDNYLIFNNINGCKVTLTSTVDSSQTVKMINQCGENKFVEFVPSGSNIYQGNSKALINGGEAELNVLNINLYGLTGDIIDSSFLPVYQSDFTTSLGLLSSTSPSTRTLALVSDEARLTTLADSTTLYVVFDVGSIPNYAVGKKYKISLNVSDFQHSGTGRPITLNYDGVNLSPTIAEGTTPVTQEYEFTATVDTSLTILSSNIGTLTGDFFSFNKITVLEKIFKVKKSSNLTGNLLDLSNLNGDNYNFNSGDTRNHATYTFDNLEVNGWVEAFVNKSGSAPTISDANVVRNTSALQVGGVPFVADTDMTMLVRYNGVTVEYKFLAR